MKTPVNTQTLKHHFAYDWWKYALVLLSGIFLVNLILTITAPRVPEDKKVDLYIYGISDSQAVDAYMEKIRQEEMQDMESMISSTLLVDETYGPMQLVTYMTAKEGDLYLLPRNEFISYASSGAFVPLEEDKELMALFSEAGLDLRRGWRTLSGTDETHLYGIPLDLLPGMSSIAYTENGYISVLAMGGNVDNALKFLRCLCRDTLPAPEQTDPPADPQ